MSILTKRAERAALAQALGVEPQALRASATASGHSLLQAALRAEDASGTLTGPGERSQPPEPTPL